MLATGEVSCAGEWMMGRVVADSERAAARGAVVMVLLNMLMVASVSVVFDRFVVGLLLVCVVKVFS